MDDAYGNRENRNWNLDASDQGIDTPVVIGSDERRMHVRAYNYWVSLLGERIFPSIKNLEPDALADFGPNSVLLDFTSNVERPVIKFLGVKLREECDLGHNLDTVDDVPRGSLLSRLTDHCLQVIANRAPVGFEAEFINQRGNDTLYRGILMPFSLDDDKIEFIYGVINWKELADADLVRQIGAELDLSTARG